MTTGSPHVAHRHIRTAMAASFTMMLAATGFVGCADESYASSESRTKPYILKEGCTFSIIAENGSSSISSPEATGVPNGMVTLSISFDDYSITMSNCAVVENSHGLPIYED